MSGRGGSPGRNGSDGVQRYRCLSDEGLELKRLHRQRLARIEGNPVHPGSRGRTCAKGVVTPNQLEDPDRILYPLKRAGARGEGRWERVRDGWPEAPSTIAPLLCAGAKPGEMWAADERGVHRSDDSGKSWRRVVGYARSPQHLRGLALLLQ